MSVYTHTYTHKHIYSVQYNLIGRSPISLALSFPVSVTAHTVNKSKIKSLSWEKQGLPLKTNLDDENRLCLLPLDLGTWSSQMIPVEAIQITFNAKCMWSKPGVPVS